MKSSTYASIGKDFSDWVYANHSIEVSYSPLLEAFSNPGEPMDQFKARITQTARELRDNAMEELREKTAKGLKSLVDKQTKAAVKVEAQKAQAGSAKLATAVQIGSSLLGAIFGRKKGLSAVTTLVRGSTVTSATRVMRESQEAAAAENELARLQTEQAELEKQLDDEVQKLQEQYDPAALVFETVKLTPVKKNIQVSAVGILWLPHEAVGGELRPAWT
jgi:hypothetical protein